MRTGSDLSGELLDGRFRVESPAGRGRFGTVYHGRDQTRGVACAIRVLGVPPPIAAAGASAAESLRTALRECVLRGHKLGQKTATMVKTFGFAVPPPAAAGSSARAAGGAGVAYVASAWLDGESLAESLDRRRRRGTDGAKRGRRARGAHARRREHLRPARPRRHARSAASPRRALDDDRPRARNPAPRRRPRDGAPPGQRRPDARPLARRDGRLPRARAALPFSWRAGARAAMSTRSRSWCSSSSPTSRPSRSPASERRANRCSIRSDDRRRASSPSTSIRWSPMSSRARSPSSRWRASATATPSGARSRPRSSAAR